MARYREILRLYSQGISQRSIALSCECSRNTVAKVIARAKELNIHWPLSPEQTEAELEKLLFPREPAESDRKYPDVEYIHKELMHSGVTLKLLWHEYCEECRQNNEIPLMYSQFCYHYQGYSQKKRASMHVPRKPGEQLEVDWAGQPAALVDRDTGELIPACVFVGVLSYSQYAYVEAFLSMDLASWITAHVNMYRFFGGSTRIIMPPTVKTR